MELRSRFWSLEYADTEELNVKHMQCRAKL